MVTVCFVNYSHADDFNLSFGVQLAYIRCLNKAWEKKKNEYEMKIKENTEKAKEASNEIADNNGIIKKMISSLGV